MGFIVERRFTSDRPTRRPYAKYDNVSDDIEELLPPMQEELRSKKAAQIIYWQIQIWEPKQGCDIYMMGSNEI